MQAAWMYFHDNPVSKFINGYVLHTVHIHCVRQVIMEVRFPIKLTVFRFLRDNMADENSRSITDA